MSQAFDLSLFPDIPPEAVKAFEAARLELAVEPAARQHEQAIVAKKDAFITELKALIEKLEGQVGQYRHRKIWTPRSLSWHWRIWKPPSPRRRNRLPVEEKIAASETDPEKKASREKRRARALPELLPRGERVIEPDSIACLCGCSDMAGIGSIGWITPRRAIR